MPTEDSLAVTLSAKRPEQRVLWSNQAVLGAPVFGSVSP